MEKGKRIEFKKAAKIVILAIVMLAITGITAVGATTFSVGDCPNCPGSGLKFWNGLDDIPNYLGCSYFTSIDPFISGNEGHIGITEHDSKEEAVNDFEKIRKCRKTNEPNSDGILKDNQIEFVYMTKGFVNFEIHGYFLHIDKKIITHVVIKRRGISYSDREKAKTMFQELAKCAHSFTGWKGTEDKEEYTLILKHYEPYYKPGENDPRRPGDLVATLTDKNEKGVSGKGIFFYVEPETNLNKVFTYRVSNMLCSDIFMSRPETNGSYIGSGYTNEAGSVSRNYFFNFRPELFSNIVRETDRSVKGKITAVVFDEKTYEAEERASVNIELSSVAKITEISVHGPKPKIKDDKEEILVTKESGEIIPVYGKEKAPQGAECAPYELLCGDVISLDKNDYVELLWLTGLKIEIKTKPSVLKENMAHVTIGGTGLKEEFKNQIYEITQSSSYSAIGLGLLGLCIGIYAFPSTAVVLGSSTAMIAETAAFSSLCMTGSQIVIALEGIYCGEIPYVITRLKSIILVDPTSSGINFYTIEGDNELITPKGFKRNITTGHKISVLPDGTFSQISEFDRSELNEDLSYLLDSMEEDAPKDETAITAEPKLELSHVIVSSAYPKNKNVNPFCYILNNGTTDVDECHIEYDIINRKEETIHTFIGETQNVSAGKGIWIYEKVWDIPSNAKIGPYVINCALISGSKRDTAGSEFFVTHPVKSQDKTAKLEISNLYTDKSEYLRGSEEIVDVYYFVKNTGAADISEYHVIYQIFDSEGKRYSWFISDIFGSIETKEENKWKSGVWKIPNDAKIGRYTINAMVIWDIYRSSRETTYFSVN